MNKFLIAAGVGALLIVAQAAVSATYNPLDRVDATAKDDVTAPAPAATAATSTDRGYTAFADKPVRFDAGLYEVTTEKPATEPVVSDRVSAEPTSYNARLTQNATPSSTLSCRAKKIVDFYYGSSFRAGAGARCEGRSSTPMQAVFVGLAAGVATAVVVSDKGETD